MNATTSNIARAIAALNVTDRETLEQLAEDFSWRVSGMKDADLFTPELFVSDVMELSRPWYEVPVADLVADLRESLQAARANDPELSALVGSAVEAMQA